VRLVQALVRLVGIAERGDELRIAVDELRAGLVRERIGDLVEQGAEEIDGLGGAPALLEDLREREVGLDVVRPRRDHAAQPALGALGVAGAHVGRGAVEQDGGARLLALELEADVVGQERACLVERAHGAGVIAGGAELAGDLGQRSGSLGAGEHGERRRDAGGGRAAGARGRWRRRRGSGCALGASRRSRRGGGSCAFGARGQWRRRGGCAFGAPRRSGRGAAG
jgi:hypothetical protein